MVYGDSYAYSATQDIGTLYRSEIQVIGKDIPVNGQ
jgi:hypothetical protein